MNQGSENLYIGSIFSNSTIQKKSTAAWSATGRYPFLRKRNQIKIKIYRTRPCAHGHTSLKNREEKRNRTERIVWLQVSVLQRRLRYYKTNPAMQLVTKLRKLD